MGLFRKKIYKQIEPISVLQAQPIMRQASYPQVESTNVITIPSIEKKPRDETIIKLRDYLLKLSDSLLETAKWLENK